MKRHPALIPLSRFHRSMLFLAWIARENAPAVKGYPEKMPERMSYAVYFYQEKIRTHFEKERRLWDFIEERYPSLSGLIGELSRERKKLILTFEKLSDEPDEALFLQLGPALEKHVRREERELFQKVQQIASEEDMETIAQLTA